jgi:DNA-binding NtrC family response regulator
MTVASTILFFAEGDYPFARPTIAGVPIAKVTQPSELIDLVKRERYPIILFDTAHPQFAESLVTRIYRRSSGSDLWLLSAHEHHDLPDFMIDAVISPQIDAADFAAHVTTGLNTRRLLAEYRLVGKSPNLKRAATMIAQVAPTNMSTLIIGPSGSGKEVVAHAVHQHSSRRDKPFIAVNCGALVESLLESELFGYEKGAFTGAVGRREGIFKRADGGTVFLDEIGETSPALQVKLLRILEEGHFYRVGGGDMVQTDVRVVAATNRELTESIQDGEFREDLYFRLGAVRINLLGLADRKADIIPLVDHFFQQETGAPRGMSQKAMELLVNYRWPGNVRQLHNFVNRIIAMGESSEISEQQVTQFIEEQGYVHRNLPVVTGRKPQEAEFQLIYQALLSLGQEVRMLRELILDHLPARQVVEEAPLAGDGTTPRTMDEMEAELIRKTLAAVGGNRREAARKLGIGERTVYRKLKKYGDR